MGILDRLTGASEWKARRSVVEKDRVYYCQMCGERKAEIKPGEKAALCSASCQEAFNNRSFLESMSGALVVDVDGGAGPLLNAVQSARRTKYCKWCGCELLFSAQACNKCKGDNSS